MGEAQVIAQTAESVRGALKFFYQDQGRYPSVSEFLNQGVMQNYLNNFPLPEFSSKSCSQSFVYKRPNLQSFQLNFCLPVSVDNYRQGWDTVTKTD